MKVKVGISNRHIHLCKKDADILFGENYRFTKRNDLSQNGEWACNEIVQVSTDKYVFDHVRVMGPLRDYTQVEVSIEDAKEKLNKKIGILSEGKAIIPDDVGNEKYCYEFKGKVEDKEFLVYVDVYTGEEENILIILETEGGTLTI